MKRRILIVMLTLVMLLTSPIYASADEAPLPAPSGAESAGVEEEPEAGWWETILSPRNFPLFLLILAIGAALGMYFLQERRRKKQK